MDKRTTSVLRTKEKKGRRRPDAAANQAWHHKSPEQHIQGINELDCQVISFFSLPITWKNVILRQSSCHKHFLCTVLYSLSVYHLCLLEIETRLPRKSQTTYGTGYKTISSLANTNRDSREINLMLLFGVSPAASSPSS